MVQGGIESLKTKQDGHAAKLVHFLELPRGAYLLHNDGFDHGLLIGNSPGLNSEQLPRHDCMHNSTRGCHS